MRGEQVTVNARVLGIRAYIVGAGMLQGTGQNIMASAAVVHACPEAQFPGHRPPRVTFAAQKHTIAHGLCQFSITDRADERRGGVAVRWHGCRGSVSIRATEGLPSVLRSLHSRRLPYRTLCAFPYPTR